MTKDKIKELKGIVGSIIILCGLDYVPMQNEYVKVKLHGRWEDARIVFVEESKHQCKIVLKESCGIDRVQRLQSEYIRVLTNEFIDPLSFDFNVNVISQFSSLIADYQKILFAESGVAQSYNLYFTEEFHLLFSSLWQRSLLIIREILNTKQLKIKQFQELPSFKDIISISSQLTPMKYGKELKLCTCSYAFTGKKYHEQVFYQCLTCKMKKNQGICAFCAKTCHRGHVLSQPKLESFYCDCGSGAAKMNCISLQTPPEDTILSMKRLESLALRVRDLLPLQTRGFSGNRNGGDGNLDSDSMMPTRFVNSGDRSGYTISNSQKFTFKWKNANGFSMIGSDLPFNPIQNSFYFEIKVSSLGGRNGGIALGFSSKINHNQPFPQVLESSFSYHLLAGHFYNGSKFFQVSNTYSSTRINDIFGCGWNKDSKSIYFTKNGKLISSQIPLKGIGKQYFPFFLISGEGGAILPNLGTKKFSYNVSLSLKGQKSRSTRSKTQVSSLKSSKNKNFLNFNEKTKEEKIKMNIDRLGRLGFKLTNCVEAVGKYEDVNSAAAYLHRRAMRPLRYQLSDNLVQMGFDRPLCIKALELSRDDVNLALNWLLEESHTIQRNGGGINIENGGKVQQQIYPDRGIPFIGSNIDDRKVETEIMMGLLKDANSKTNLNNFTNIKKFGVKKYSLVVVNPYLKEDIRSQTNTRELRGKHGVILSTSPEGSIVQSLDPLTSKLVSGFIKSNDLIKLTEELDEDCQFSKLSLKLIEYYKNIGILLSRKMLKYFYRHTSFIKIDPLTSFSNSIQLYNNLKVIFFEQNHLQDHVFKANTPKLSKKMEKLFGHLEDVDVITSKNGETQRKGKDFFSYLANDALKEIEKYQDGLPYYRKVIFKKEYNNKRIQIRFWGATSLFISFSGRCKLPSKYDFLSFYYGNLGNQMMYFDGDKKKVPRYLCVPGDRFWFEFKSANLRETSGFQFHVTPASFRLSENQLMVQSNTGLAAMIIQNATIDHWKSRINEAKKTFEISINYLMTPFAPFKGTISNGMEALIQALYVSKFKPNVNIIKAFRIELEDLYISFKKRSENTDIPLPIFHSLVELMSVFRKYLSTDLCRSVFPYQDCNQHMYCYRQPNNSSKKKNDVVTCTSCAMNQHIIQNSTNLPFYHSHSFAKCQVNFSKDFVWIERKKENQEPNNINPNPNPNPNPITTIEQIKEEEKFQCLMPYKTLEVSPSDWFTHTSWIDQLTIVRNLLDLLVRKEKQLKEIKLPNWILYEAAVELSKEAEYKESPHPYQIVKDEGCIEIKGARVLYITFDKHTHTHELDKISFSRYKIGNNDLGDLYGSKLKDKTFVIEGSKIYYQFKATGGNHRLTCRGCKRPIIGCRFHCCHPDCDDVEFCEDCVAKKHMHPSEHIFLKIRRPIDWQPASLPILYTYSWKNTSTYRGNVHKGINCDGCNKKNIVGNRYWCENCKNFNLCENCAKEEYKHHNRLHVFLRIVRPLPANQKKLANNHLPYGLIYEKKDENYWGYLFKVTSEKKFSPNSKSIQSLMSNIQTEMMNWTLEKDSALLEYVDRYHGSWRSLKPKKLLKISKNELEKGIKHFPLLRSMSKESMAYRFIIIKLLNLKLSRILNLVNMEAADNRIRKTHVNLSTLIAMNRQRIFYSIKKDLWDGTIKKTLVEAKKAIDLKLDRKKAADAKSSQNQITSAFNSLFIQGYNQVQAINPQVLSRREGAWKVTLIGEKADDYGGPFRESITQMCQELQSEQLDLFLRVPNGQHSVGENREKYMPNPRARSYLHMKWYRFVGILIGVSVLSKNLCPFDLPSIFWKQFVKQDLNLMDLNAIDQHAYQSMIDIKNIHLKGIDADSFEYCIMQNFVTNGSDGVEVELVKGGGNKVVTFDNRIEYANLCEKYRLKETNKQVTAIRDGLFSLLPSRFFPIFKWNELETLICGKATIDINVLKEHTVYEEYKSSSRVVKFFWNVFESFTDIERQLYLRFVWGRSRLPINEEGFSHNHKIQRLQRPNPDQVLPLSHTCFFSIELPNYSSQQILREKLLYAIMNCVAIDTDNRATRQTF